MSAGSTHALQRRWLAFCHRIGAGNAEQEWDTLAKLYGEHHRAYHNLSHIAECLALLDQHRDLAVEPDTIEMAIWFHDVIYNPRSRTNEEDSADHASRFLEGNPIRQETVRLILATRHLAPVRMEGDAALIADIDLSILGAAPEIYDRYSKAIRREYAHVAEDDYIKGRTLVLRHFLDMDAIFHHPPFQQGLAEQARCNLMTEILSLQG